MRILRLAATWLLLLHLYFVACFEPLTTAVVGGIAIIGAGIIKKVVNSCYYTECCYEPYIKLNYTGLEKDLNARLHGQHLVIPTVLRSLKSHTRDLNPQKPLVLSFHGWTGAGKNFVTRMIIDNLYKKKEKSQYVHIFNSEIHFKHPDKINVYKDNLHSWIYHNVSKCDRSLFVFDEMDHMPEGMIDVLIPFLGHSVQVDGVDFRKSVFIFLSNTGGDMITKAVIRQWERGRKREAIKLRDMQALLEICAYNQESGLRQSKLVHKNLIDHFIPFLPLERSHVRWCIIDEFRRQNIKFEDADITDVLDELQWFPDNLNLYSTSGCKKIAQKIGLFGFS